MVGIYKQGKQFTSYYYIQRILNNLKMPEKHHLHQFEPDWQSAKRHGKANRTGLANMNATNIQGEYFCNCCGQHLEKEPVNLFVHSKELQFLGFGFPLFYEFLKYCIILLIVHIGCYNALSLQQAVADNYEFCHNTNHQEEHSSVTAEIAYKCYTFMIQLARIESVQTSEELTIRSVSFAIHLLALLYIRNKITKLESYYDERSTTLSDYTILVKGFAKPEGNLRRSILTFLSKEVKPNLPQVQEILILPHFEKIDELKKNRKKILNRIRPYYSKQRNEKEQLQLTQLKNQLLTANNQIIKAANQSFNEIKADRIDCQRAILVFSTEQDKVNALNAFQNTQSEILKSYFGEKSRVRGSEAPDPEQIIWENFNLPIRKRAIMTVLGWTLSVLLLVAVFVVFFFILVQKSVLLESSAEKLAQNPDESDLQTAYRGAVALVFILMFLVVLFDKLVLAPLFHKFTQLERPRTTAILQFSFALKLSLGLFFTTALMTLATEAIKFGNYYTHPYGVVDEQTIMFFMNAVFIPFFWLVNPFNIVKAIKRKWHHGRKDMTQHEANKLMEDQAYDLGKRFAEIIETMWFVFFYGTLIPIGAVISVFGLSFYFWVDKYNLLRRSKVHGKVSGSFIKTSLLLLDFTLILRPVGSIIFDIHLRGKAYQTSNIIFICIAFVYIIIPKDYLIQVVNPQNFRLEQKKYSEVKQLFRHNYHTNHPLFSILEDEDITNQKIIDESVRRSLQSGMISMEIIQKGGNSLDSNVGLIL